MKVQINLTSPIIGTFRSIKDTKKSIHPSQWFLCYHKHDSHAGKTPYFAMKSFDNEFYVVVWDCGIAAGKWENFSPYHSFERYLTAEESVVLSNNNSSN